MRLVAATPILRVDDLVFEESMHVHQTLQTDVSVQLAVVCGSGQHSVSSRTLLKESGTSVQRGVSTGAQNRVVRALSAVRSMARQVRTDQTHRLMVVQ